MSRISAIKSALPALEFGVRHFVASKARFCILRTLGNAHADCRTLLILDSSFNPPSLAHASLAIAPVVQRGLGFQAPYRLLLLFSTHNADKVSDQAVFSERIAMMTLLAQDLVDELSSHSVAEVGRENGEMPIDIGLTKAPYYHDKSEAISKTMPSPYPSRPTHVHLVGYDNIIRITAPRYYADHSPPLAALGPFFEAGHRFLVTLRPHVAADETSREFGTVEAQREFIERLQGGAMEAEGLKRSWARQIDVIQGKTDAAQGVSSTRIRKAVAARQWHEVESLCTPSVAIWLADTSTPRMRACRSKQASSTGCPTPPPRRKEVGDECSGTARLRRRGRHAYTALFNPPFSSESSLSSEARSSPGQTKHQSASPRKDFWKQLFERDINFSILARRSKKKTKPENTLRRSKSVGDFLKKPFAQSPTKPDALRRSKSFHDLWRRPFASSPVKADLDHMQKTSSRGSLQAQSGHSSSSSLTPRQGYLSQTGKDANVVAGVNARSRVDQKDTADVFSRRANRTPSSGLASHDIPSAWGAVVRASSTYSRPISPNSSRLSRAPTNNETSPPRNRRSAHVGLDYNASGGAWARYPSHTREARTGPAGLRDSVVPRDFSPPLRAVSAPTVTPSTSGTIKMAKTRSSGLQKSSSIHLAKTMIRNYSSLFRAQSTDFHKYGRGHRTSISTGGILDYPELEMITPAFGATPRGSDMDGAEDDTGPKLRASDFDGTVECESRPIRKLSSWGVQRSGSSSYSMDHTVPTDGRFFWEKPGNQGRSLKLNISKVAPIGAAEIYARWYIEDCVEKT